MYDVLMLRLLVAAYGVEQSLTCFSRQAGRHGKFLYVDLPLIINTWISFKNIISSWAFSCQSTAFDR